MLECMQKHFPACSMHEACMLHACAVYKGHGKLPLDSNKLNFLKVLVFSKFPEEFAVEKEKVWKFLLQNLMKKHK